MSYITAYVKRDARCYSMKILYILYSSVIAEKDTVREKHGYMEQIVPVFKDGEGPGPCRSRCLNYGMSLYNIIHQLNELEALFN